MAKPALPVAGYLDRWGPHPQHVPPGGWGTKRSALPRSSSRRIAASAGSSAGSSLKVRDNRVIGFEPWQEFPFNRGMLCPKGVKRYMQSGHPDRLLDPMMRDETQGFRVATWDEALDLTARRIREIQEKHGPDSVAVFGGASLTTEKSYLLGKFARVALGTRHIDYNGRLCMVSAGTAYKLAFGVDRSPNPWADIPKAQVAFVAGANVGECAPITTDYLWRMRDAGGVLIVADPRMTPITRNADQYLPVRPGTDVALFSAMLNVVIREGLVRRDFVDAHTTGFEAVAESVKTWDLRRAAELTGVPPDAIEKAALTFARADRAVALHARGIEHHSKGVENCLALINLCLATGNIGREGAGCMMITGQGNGQGGASTGRSATSFPDNGRSPIPPRARMSPSVWGSRPRRFRKPGSAPSRSWRRSTAARSRR